MSQYDKIASDYVETTKAEISRKYIEDPNILRIIGEVVGLDVLGVGCGNGYLERLLKKAVAGHVVGIDLSAEMLRVAEEAESEEPLGIEYQQHNLVKLPIIGEFDLATAKYVLNYAESRGDLQRMCWNIGQNLRRGGRLIALVPDYDRGFPGTPKYGFSVEPISEPFHEGDKLRVTLYGGGNQVQFEVSFILTESFRLALAAAGFRDIAFHQLLPSPEGIEEFGEEFWAEWVAHPYSTIIEARR